MKPCCTFLTALLLFTFCSLTLTQSSYNPNKCCFKHMKKRVPEAYVKHFEETSPECSNPGIILYTIQHKKMCVNPNDKWVERLLRILQNRMKDRTLMRGDGPGTY